MWLKGLRPHHVCCLTTMTPGRCWVEGGGWNCKKGFISTLSNRCCFVKLKGDSCIASVVLSLMKASPSRWRIASTMVSRFWREVLAKYTLACGTTSSPLLEAGEGSLSTSVLGSALMAASKMEGSEVGVAVAVGGAVAVAAVVAGVGVAGGEGVVAMTVSVWLTGCRLAAETTCRVATALAVS